MKEKNTTSSIENMAKAKSGKNALTKTWLFALMVLLLVAFSTVTLLNNTQISSYADVLDGFSANSGSVVKNDNMLDYTISGENSYLQSPTINAREGSKLYANLSHRNTIMVSLKNDSEADKITLSYITSKSLQFSADKTKQFSILPSSGYTTYYFNLSDSEKADGILKGFRLAPNAKSGSINIRHIAFEREQPIINYIGEVSSCTSDGKTVTVTGKVSGYDKAVVKLYGYTLSNTKDELSKATFLAKSTVQNGSFTIKTPFINQSLNNLSSQFLVAIDGQKVDKPFKIQNAGDITTNPYKFEIKDNVITPTLVGDGVTDDTAALQAAINEANAAGGGTVIVKGDNSTYGKRYIATSLSLKSNVELKIEKGAVLWQSGNMADYNYQAAYGHDIAMAGIQWTHAALVKNLPLIYIGTATNVKVTGGGQLRSEDTGANTTTPTVGTVDNERIHIVPIGIYNSKNVEINDIEFIRTNGYHMTVYKSENVYIGAVTFKEVNCLGGDGISIGNGSKNVKIDATQMYVTDDALVLWSTSVGEKRGLAWWEITPNGDNRVQNIEVANSYISGGHTITFIPWGSDATDLSKQEISDINIHDSYLSDGITAVGGWFDNPYYGASRGDNGFAGEVGDHSSVKNVTMQNNFYDGLTLFSYAVNGVAYTLPATNVQTDCTLTSPSNFSNSTFERSGASNFVTGLSYWSHSSEGASFATSGNNHYGKAENGAKLYQGLQLTRGEHTFSAKTQKLSEGAKIYVADAKTGEVLKSESITNTSLALQSLTFKLVNNGLYYLGVTNAAIDDANVTSVAIAPPSTLYDESFEGERISLDIKNYEVKQSDGNNALYNPNLDYSILPLTPDDMNSAYGLQKFDLNLDVKISELTSDLSGGFGIEIGRVHPNFNSYFYLAYNAVEKSVKISRYDKGKENILAKSFDTELSSTISSKMLIKYDGKNMEWYINDELAVRATNPGAKLTANKINFVTHYSRLAIDNIKVSKFDSHDSVIPSYDEYFAQDFTQSTKFFEEYNFIRATDGFNSYLKWQSENDNTLLTLPSNYQDFDFRTNIMFTDKVVGALNIKFGDNKTNYYSLNYNADDKTFKLIKFSNGRELTVATAVNYILEGEKWYDLGLSKSGGALQVYINGEKILSATDSEPLPHGGALSLITNKDVCYDNITMQQSGVLDYLTVVMPPVKQQENTDKPITPATKSGCNGCKSSNAAAMLALLPLALFAIKKKR